MFMRRRCHRRNAPFASGLLLSTGLLLIPIAPATSSAGEPERKIEVSSAKTDDGQSTVTVVISGIPPEELGSEGMKALLGYLTGRRNIDGLTPAVKPGGPAPRPAGGDRDEREFDLELNIHWRRATDDPKGDAEHEARKSGVPKSPKEAAEPKTAHPAKESGTTFDSLKKMISGGPATPAPAATDAPPNAKKGDVRRNDEEVEAILRSLGNLQKQVAEHAKGAERVRALAENAEKTKETPESEQEIRKVAEAAAELEKLARDLEKRSRDVEKALDQARARLGQKTARKLEQPGQPRPKDEPQK